MLNAFFGNGLSDEKLISRAAPEPIFLIIRFTNDGRLGSGFAKTITFGSVDARKTQYAINDDPLWQDSCHHLKFNQLGALRVDSVSL